jgi:hypothetical protein
MDIPSEESVKRVVGHQFPGGEYLIAHWENFLLTECTGAEALPDGLAHPVALFHVPFLGANTSIGEMFELGQAKSEFSIGIESYEWEFFRPLMEEALYQISGSILSVDRVKAEGRIYDRIKFRFDIRKDDQDIAKSTIIWHYNRGRYDRS